MIELIAVLLALIVASPVMIGLFKVFMWLVRVTDPNRIISEDNQRVLQKSSRGKQ